MQTSMRTATVILAALSGAASAADWELNPRVEAGYLYDNNYRLSPPGTEVGVQGPLADAQLEMRARTQQGEFSFTPRVSATYFPDHQELDAIDYFGTLYWQHRGQRVTTEIHGEYSQQDVVNSEQPHAEVPADSGLGEGDTGDAGIAFLPNRRHRAAVRPVMDFEMSQRNTFRLAANYADVKFDEQFYGAQQDYKSGDVSAALVTRFTPVSSLTARLRAAQYDIETLGDSDSYGAELQWDTRTAAEMEAFVRVGAQNVKYESGVKENAWLAGAGVSMPFGRNQLFADLVRTVGPSSAGIIITRDQLRVRWQRDFTPRLAFLLGVRGTHDEDISDGGTFRPRTYATGDIGLQWRWEEEFSLLMAYDYTWQKFDQSALDPATSSGASISVIYQPLQRRR